MNQQLIRRGSTLIAPQVDYLLLDGSGSMLSKQFETIAALDVFAGQLRSSNINSQLILQVFDDHDMDSIQRDDIIAAMPLFRHKPPQCGWGLTPLYDAINIMARRMRELNPDTARIIIITDGKATSMGMTTHDQARALLDWCRAKGWQVTFFGCDFNNSAQAKLLGADDSNSVGVQKALLSDAAKNLGDKAVRHAVTGTDIRFTDDEKSQFGGYLTGPSNGE